MNRSTTPQRKTPSRKKDRKTKETVQSAKLQTTSNLIAPWKRKEIAMKSLDNDSDLIILPINLRVWTTAEADNNDRLSNENENNRNSRLNRETSFNNNRLPSINGDSQPVEMQSNQYQLAPVANVLLLSSMYEIRHKLAAIASTEIRNFQLELLEEQIMVGLKFIIFLIFHTYFIVNVVIICCCYLSC
jgi:hypothetical protein